MRALEIPFHALRTQHAAIERELLPRLEADHLVLADLELNAALLTAEAAVCLDEPLRFDARGQPRAGHRREMRPEPLDDTNGIRRNFGHGRLPCLSRVANRADGARRLRPSVQVL